MTGAAKSVVAGTCVLLLITGCGGGGSSTANTDPKAETPTPTAVATPTAQPTPTHAEFIRRFDKTCTEPTAYKGMSQQFEDKFEAGEYEAAADLSARLTRGATVVQERRRS